MLFPGLPAALSQKSSLPKRLVIFIAPALLSFRATGILLQCQHE